MQIRAGNGGWHRAAADELGLPGAVYYRVQEVDGALRMTELYIDGRGVPIQAGALRRFPVQVLEQWAEAVPTARDRLRTAAPDLSRLASYFATTVGSGAKGWIADSMRAQYRDDVVQPPYARDQGGRIQVEEEVKLAPPAEGLTDAFFRDLTKAYDAAVAQGRPPATAIAEQLPGYDPSQATTMRRLVESWIYKARQRGVMPRARQKGRVV
ncbi:hypothetical protein [Nocardioides sp. MH1]|uniref:hypothetical protein n=1 Tax=Nocardioides sp. MH1 TaxID=3242490 RepID=UPI003520F48A